ncbi:C1 domain/Zinc finger, ZZ type/HECT-domain (ubiquitin-transferase), putative [Angomonas deanei]|uniref:HECT-type E3 ubiquitin transferase n=1 Tax=Angomonas deanei TaxID=59799 RepID=A0A7G2CT81_9TRYP|nr:C1 domain/Zinc finger, ZZ type/HECT-domain (ubiquitin-transferase), putative [Angomonas deanei]
MVESSVESEVDSDGNSVAVDDDEPAPQQGEEAEVAPPPAPNAEPEEPVDYSDNELAINRILALFNMADTLTNRNGNAAQADATDNTAAAAAPAEAVPEVVVNPPPEDDQPWLGLVEPTFIESIPQDIRESILFEHMPQLRGEVEYTFLNRQTRVYHSFLSLLPEPVQLNVLDIEGRFAAVHDAPAAEGDGATALYELLLSVESEPEIRQDILRECDITLLANYPELRRESERLRRERLPEAPRLMNMREYPMDVVVRDPFADATRLESIRRIFSRDLSDAHSNNRSSSRIKAVETKPPTCDSEYHVLAPRVVRLSVAEMKMCIRLLKLHTPMKKDSNTDLRTQITALLRTLCGTQRQTVEVLTALLEVGREGLDEQGSPAALTGRSSMFTNVLVLFSELCKVTSIVPIALMLLPDGCLNKETMKDVNAPLDSTEKEYVAHHPLKMLLDYVSVNISASSVTRNLFVTILSNLIQIRDSLVKEDTPKEGGDSLFNRMPESDENIRHPRHEHRLQWTDVSQLASYSEGFICNICGTNPHNRLCFHCGICNFDLCASCGRERLTVEEMTTRLRRCMYYTVNMDGFMQRVVELLESKSSAHYNGTLIRLVKPMLYESAKRDKEYDGPRSAVSVVEEALQRAAGVLTPAIRETRKVFRQTVEDVVRQHLTEAGSPTNAEARQDSFASTVTIPEDIQFDSSEGLQFLEILNMAELEEGQIFSLIAPYVEAQRPEPREISIMWRATQMLIQDTTALLQHLTSPGTLPLPESVVSLFTSYCVYHVHSMKRDRSSASASAFSNRQFVSPGETERFLSEETRDPSPLSTQARKEISENDEGGHRAARGGHNRSNIFDFMLPWQGATFLQDAFRGRGMDDDESENNTPVTTLATNPAAERRPLSRTVRRFLEANRVTLDCILRWNPTLIKTTLSFLQTEPGLIDFSLRIKEFRRRLARNREDSLDITINRQRCLQESFTKMKGKKSYRGSLRVRFEGEEGADAGGLSREWFQLLAKDIVNESYALFIHSSEASTFQPNPLSDVNAEHLEYFEFVGIILGMTIVHNVAIDLHFTRSVYRHMVGLQPIFLDLESVDPELYNNLQWMLKHDVTDIELYFAVNYERFGEVMEEELMPGGKDVLVTESNKLQYIRLLCEFHMTKRISPQLLHLLKGFYTVIPFEEIQNFSAQELELVICGVPDINTDDLRANTLYEGYSASSPQVRWFWEVVQTMTAEDKANLLQFATGASKVPHGGFANLVGTGDLPQKFTISRWMESPELLPLAHTCFNKIDLPEYPSLEVLREKLMLAITFGSMGFTMV